MPDFVITFIIFVLVLTAFRFIGLSTLLISAACAIILSELGFEIYAFALVAISAVVISAAITYAEKKWFYSLSDKWLVSYRVYEVGGDLISVGDCVVPKCFCTNNEEITKFLRLGNGTKANGKINIVSVSKLNNN